MKFEICDSCHALTGDEEKSYCSPECRYAAARSKATRSGYRNGSRDNRIWEEGFATALKEAEMMILHTAEQHARHHRFHEESASLMIAHRLESIKDARP